MPFAGLADAVSDTGLAAPRMARPFAPTPAERDGVQAQIPYPAATKAPRMARRYASIASPETSSIRLTARLNCRSESRP